jgi:hypothetical protein
MPTPYKLALGIVLVTMIYVWVEVGRTIYVCVR